MPNESRRKLLKSMTVAGGVVVAGKNLPEGWVKPVVDSVVLPAHAATTDDTGGLPGFTPASYYGTSLPRSGLASVMNSSNSNLVAATLGLIVPAVQAGRLPGSGSLPGMSVVSDGVNATVRFLSSDADNIHQAVAPLDGTPSGPPLLDPASCFDPTEEGSGGPLSVQIISYIEGADPVRVRVNASRGGGWEVDVPMAAVGPLILVGCQDGGGLPPPPPQ